MKHTPFRLVILLQDLEFGGTQRYAINLLKHLDRRLFSPELWILRGGIDMLPLARETGVRIAWLSGSKWISPWALIHLFLRLVWSRPQILYTLTVVPNIWGRLFGRIVGIPAIVSGWRNRVANQYESILWPLSNRIICNSRALKEFIIRKYSIDPKRIDVVPNGIDVGYFFPDHTQRKKEPTVLYAGRLVEQKDPLNLLEAFRLTLKRVPSARLKIVGDGHLKNAIEQFIRSHSLGSSVSLLAGISDIRPMLRQAWVFALPSAYEGSPNVIIEAMATGLPVVATRVDGVPELVEEGKTGILVKAGDPQRLADALISLLTNETLRRSMGFKARERVLAHHVMDNMIQKTEQVLLDTIQDINA